ncbi:hypothetical protein ROLI_018960 [Roseobacter fucihabitans]|uniref:Uncharacterized protein n=1 Tax=Roseobacter fucihabitans TaxID=1537242 RepID=A0ABZ2BS21_9RHOB|nr:hypothetical protein [Roseobacter litoralis]MBC6967543.1 hypothetical protein [Roseobacter litoralis]
MSNVISLGLPHRPNLAQRQALLMHNFAHNRRGKEDVFWLKENAEILNMLATSGALLGTEALAPYRDIYDSLEEKLKFFPQYYRFLMSICLDLEDLGMGSGKGTALCDWAVRSGLAEAELSDLQRAEALRLVARRGFKGDDPALTERLHRFMNRPQTFVLPNKKAAYELTHIVFYLSDYGVVNPQLSPAAITSLEFVGLLAYLDQDLDLLAEVCVALRFAGHLPSAIWEDWVGAEMSGFILQSQGSGQGDVYHTYLVTSWWAEFAERPSFPGVPAQNGLHITRHASRQGPLRAMSEYMFNLGTARRGDWEVMRQEMSDIVGQDGLDILCGAEQSCERFGEFFEGFARY